MVGVTEAAGAIWPDRAQPYLPVATDPYCAGSEHSSWQRKLSLETVETILNEDLGWAVDGPLRDLKIEEKDASGRVRILRAVSGLNPRIDANEFRYTPSPVRPCARYRRIKGISVPSEK